MPDEIHDPSAVPAEERTWGMLAHIAAFAGLVVPFGSVIAPLVIYLVRKDTHPFVADQARESLNFQITSLIIGVALGIVGIVTLGFGFVLLPVAGIAWLVFVIIAAVAANDGKRYRYPVCFRLVS